MAPRRVIVFVLDDDDDEVEQQSFMLVPRFSVLLFFL
jgi:hypothetical protein